jgi:hypothetical protein
MLLELAAEYYPALFPVFCSYESGIKRADAGRYMLLHHFGGIYADLDSECVAPLSRFEPEDRVVLCHEPPSHWAAQIRYRCHPFLLFNGVMASPARHEFWRHVMDLLPRTQPAADVLDATGPALLTGAYLTYPSQQDVLVESCHLFCAEDDRGRRAAGYGAAEARPVARHYWAGTWTATRTPSKFTMALRQAYYRSRHLLTRGPILKAGDPRIAVDSAALSRPLPNGRRVTILVPVRDAAVHVEPFMEQVRALDLPKDDIKLVFCEGDSRDGTWDRLNRVAARYRPEFRDIVLTRREVGIRIERSNRWAPKLQRARRAGIATVRNHLIDVGLDESDDWALWIDIDVWKFPPDIVQRLLEAKSRIVAPHCVKVPGGPTFDQNSFVARPLRPAYRNYKYLRHGLFQPPRPPFEGRLHMDGFRHSSRVALDGVGGTMLLVDAGLHRGGLRFPELPYRDHIETEGFGLLARDLGVGAIGLPQVEILHVPW